MAEHRRAVFAIAALLLVLVVADAGWRLADAGRDLIAARAELQRSPSAFEALLSLDATRWPTAGEYRAVVRDMDAAHAHVGHARSRLLHLRAVAHVIGFLPVIGDEVGEMPRLLYVAEELTGQAALGLAAAEPLFAGQSMPVAAQQVFVDRQGDLLSAMDGVAALQPDAARLARTSWRGPFAAVAPLVRDLDARIAKVPEARSLVHDLGAAAGPLLGADRPRRYAVLAQNDQEIRPTGGFIGTMGIVRVEDGRITLEELTGVQGIEARGTPILRPPAEFSKYYGATQWNVRDSNWWPDLPTSAEAALTQFLEPIGMRNLDGLIAFNTKMVTLVIRALGPVQLPEYREPLTADNWLRQVESNLVTPDEATGIERAEVRNINLAPVMRALLGRMERLDSSQLPGLVPAAREGVGGRDFQMYSREPSVQTLLRSFGASGELPARQADGDFVAVVDTNLSESKVGPALRRDLLYLVGANDHVDVRITWSNDHSRADPVTYPRLRGDGVWFNRETRRWISAPGVFGNYVRIFLPPGTTLGRMSGFDGAPTYRVFEGRVLIEGYLKVSNGEQRSISLSYRSRGPDAPRPTHATIWKQGGSPAGTIRVLANRGEQQATLFDGAFTRDVVVAIPPGR